MVLECGARIVNRDLDIRVGLVRGVCLISQWWSGISRMVQVLGGIGRRRIFAHLMACLVRGY